MRSPAEKIQFRLVASEVIKIVMIYLIRLNFINNVAKRILDAVQGCYSLYILNPYIVNFTKISAISLIL